MAEVEARASRRARLELEEFERGGLVWERGGDARRTSRPAKISGGGKKEAKEETKSNGKEAKTNQKKRKKRE
jgi:hypothetical protein